MQFAPAMLKSTIIALVLSCCALALGGCLTPDDHDDLAHGPVAPTSLEEIAHQLEATPIPLCGDLNNVYFEAPFSCMKNGQLGIKTCHQTCDIDRAVAFTPTGTTCRIVGATCTPWVCGPCDVAEWEVPLP